MFTHALLHLCFLYPSANCSTKLSCDLQNPPRFCHPPRIQPTHFLYPPANFLLTKSWGNINPFLYSPPASLNHPCMISHHVISPIILHSKAVTQILTVFCNRHTLSKLRFYFLLSLASLSSKAHLRLQHI